jgi:hypothetical protein
MSPKKNTSKAKEKDFHDQNTDGLDSGDDNYRRRRDRNNLVCSIIISEQGSNFDRGPLIYTV